MRVSIVWVRAAAATLVSAGLVGCAGMQRAQEEQFDRAISVNARQPLWNYQRVGLDEPGCEGPLCERFSAKDAVFALRQGLTSACYEVVDPSEVRRYVQYVSANDAAARTLDIAERIMDIGFHAMEHAMEMEHGERRGGRDVRGGLDAQTRSAVATELGLDGFIETSVSVMEPDEITGFYDVILDVGLTDAFGRQTVWVGRFPGSVMDVNDAGATLTQLATLGGQAIARRASACGEPVEAAVTQHKVRDFKVERDRIALPDRVYFELGKATIDARSFGLLDEVAAWIQGQTQVRGVEVQGYTDDIGDDANNLKLSQARADAVRSYLVERGVSGSVLSARGFGESEPLVANDSSANRAQNRRVEFRVMR